MGLGSKIFLLLGLVMTIVVLLTSTKVAAARNVAEASTATRKAEAVIEALKAEPSGPVVSAPCVHFWDRAHGRAGGCP
ncbi:hypothetical protein AB3S75_019433 [Citrus x aurantiifolia]